MEQENDTIQYHQHDLQRLRALIEEIIESRCRNVTSTVIKELRSLLKSDNGTEVVEEQHKTEDSLAVLYIVFVLMFFAASLLVLLLKFLRRERESQRLQKFYEDYLESKHPSMVVHYDDTGRRLDSPVRHPSSLALTPSQSPAPTPTPTPAVTPPPTPTYAGELFAPVF